MPKRWRDTDGVHLDLRGLESPEPMIAILTEIDGPGDDAVIAHMDREPIFLYPEIDERDWTWQLCDSEGFSAFKVVFTKAPRA